MPANSLGTRNAWTSFVLIDDPSTRGAPARIRRIDGASGKTRSWLPEKASGDWISRSSCHQRPLSSNARTRTNERGGRRFVSTDRGTGPDWLNRSSQQPGSAEGRTSASGNAECSGSAMIVARSASAVASNAIDGLSWAVSNRKVKVPPTGGARTGPIEARSVRRRRSFSTSELFASRSNARRAKVAASPRVRGGIEYVPPSRVISVRRERSTWRRNLLIAPMSARCQSGSQIPPLELESVVFFVCPDPEPRDYFTLAQSDGSEVVSDPNHADPVSPFFEFERGVSWIAFPEGVLLTGELLRTRRKRIKAFPKSPMRLAYHGRSPTCPLRRSLRTSSMRPRSLPPAEKSSSICSSQVFASSSRINDASSARSCGESS